ncbi:MAG: hypothetical protein AAF693_19235 [Bacteroidota bacterium]
MGKIIDRKMDDWAKSFLEGAEVKGEELAKHLIIYKAYYGEIKEALEADKVSFKVRKNIIASFMQFVVEFETICVKAHKPLSGSGSSAKEIISMYSSRMRNLEQDLKKVS